MRLDQFARIQVGRGSYMPVLMKIVQETKGPIFELGCGYVSTPYLHWACYATKRKLVSFESDPGWHHFASKFANDHHEVHLVDDWDKIDLSGECCVAFIDHGPNERRRIDIPRLHHAEYVVIHDTENSEERKYGFSRAIRGFRYRYKYTDANPKTTVCSDLHDLSVFNV